ncbi:MAG: NADH-quinone oxidoreductase subunit C [Pseudomonadota bacterium]
MMNGLNQLETALAERFADKAKIQLTQAIGELTLEVAAKDWFDCCLILKNEENFAFHQLLDLCGVDYSEYGVSEWQTEEKTTTGFSRAVMPNVARTDIKWEKPRFAVVIHLLSLKHNLRLRVRTYAEGEPPKVASIVKIWNVANWFEREAFDLFGIIFDGHPDLRRILTDYGFIGHPFRKDFPLIGKVEPRYDAADKRIVYEPVSIEPRTLVPKVIREDNRYLDKKSSDTVSKEDEQNG